MQEICRFLGFVYLLFADVIAKQLSHSKICLMLQRLKMIKNGSS